jgi:hypothetical protein
VKAATGKEEANPANILGKKKELTQIKTCESLVFKWLFAERYDSACPLTETWVVSRPV